MGGDDFVIGIFIMDRVGLAAIDICRLCVRNSCLVRKDMIDDR